MRHLGLNPVGSRTIQTFIALGLCTFPAWGAATLTLPAANPPTTVLAGGVLSAKTQIANCNIGGANTAPLCTDTAFVSQTMSSLNSTFLVKSFNGVKPVAPNPFQAAFTTFANTAAGAAWDPTVVNGGALDVTISINQFSATPIGLTSAGMTISASVAANAGYAGPALDQLAWTQVTYDNFFPPSTPAAPATLTDSYLNNGGNPKGNGKGPFSSPCVAILAPAKGGNSSFAKGGAGKGKAYCDPIYPFQNGSAGFFDQPKGRWSVPASFRAIALLSSVSMNNAGKLVLTVYNGFTYGFDLKTPEPGFRIFLSSMGMVLIVLLYRRHTAKL